MKTSELSNLAREYMGVWNAGGEDILDRVAKQDINVSYTHFEQPCIGISNYKLLLRGTYRFFPDIRISLGSITPCENLGRVTVEWEYEGTHSVGTLFGVEPSGQRVKIRGISILQIRDGLVAAESGIVDNLSLVLQIGAFRMK